MNTFSKQLLEASPKGIPVAFSEDIHERFPEANPKEIPKAITKIFPERVIEKTLEGILETIPKEILGIPESDPKY